MRRPLAGARTLVVSAVVVLGIAVLVGAAAGDEPTPGEPEQLFQITDERLTESSGLAASWAHDGIVYAHNDSGHDAEIYAVDGDGTVVATMELGEVDPVDWESTAPGPDGRIWVGDIGDNHTERPEVALYRFREPAELFDQSVLWSRFRLTYEDGPQDAEALLVHPQTGRVFIMTKGAEGGVVYTGPPELSSDRVNVVTLVAEAPELPALVTGGEFLPDGSGVVIRTYTKAYVYDFPSWEKRGELAMPMQPQGESLAVTADSTTILIGSEGPNSWVYEAPVDALSPTVEAPTPSPSATRTPKAQGSGGDDESDEGAGGLPAALDRLFGGVPWWIPASALGVAVLAGVLAFPRPRPHGPPPDRDHVRDHEG